MGGVDCAETEAHQFALLEYEEYGPPIKGRLDNRQQHIDDFTLLRTMPPKPRFTEVPPPGTVSINNNAANIIL